MAYKHISWAPSHQVGDMICSVCNKKITEGEYLIIEHYVSRRGNEDDWNEIKHKECSKNDRTWKKHRKETIEKEEKRLAQLKIKKEKAIQMIQNAEKIFFDEDEWGDDIIICTGA